MAIVLDNGVTIDETTWNGKNFTPASQVEAVFGYPRSTSRLTIHHWGKLGQNFTSVANYMAREGQGDTSAHFVLQEDRVACIIDPANAAWHAGNAEGNATSTGIECRPECTEGDIETLISFIRWYESVYGPQEIWIHKWWHNTACPGKYEAQLDRIIAGANEVKNGTPVQTAPEDRVAEIRAELEKIRQSANNIEGSL